MSKYDHGHTGTPVYLLDKKRDEVARSRGATDRQIDTIWSEYIGTCEIVRTGQKMVRLDNAIAGDGFAMTPGEAEELAARLIELAREARS